VVGCIEAGKKLSYREIKAIIAAHILNEDQPQRNRAKPGGLDAATVIKQLTKMVAAIPSPGLWKQVQDLSCLLDVSIVDKKNGHQSELEALVREINRATLRLEDCSDRLRKHTASKSEHGSETVAQKHDEPREGGGVQGTTSAETSVDDGKQAPASPVSQPEKQAEQQVDTRSSKPEVASSEITDSAVVDHESELIALPEAQKSQENIHTGFFDKREPQAESNQAPEHVPEAVKVSCENLSLIAKSNQAPEHIAVELALNLSKEVKEFQQSGNRRVLIEALKDTFLIARASAALRSEIARTTALEALTNRIHDIKPRFLPKIAETLAKAGAFDLSAITGVSRAGKLVNINQMMGIDQRRTSELTTGSSGPNYNPVKQLGDFIETLEHIHDHLGTKAKANKDETEVNNTTVSDPEKQPVASQDARDSAMNRDAEKTGFVANPVSEGPKTEKQSGKQGDEQPSKTEVGETEVGLSWPVLDFESKVMAEVIALRKQAEQIPILGAQVENLKKDKKEAEKNQKEVENMFLITNDNFDKLVDLYEIIYNHFHLNEAGVISPEGIISPLECRQGKFPS
jgi:hypothetical protein